MNTKRMGLMVVGLLFTSSGWTATKVASCSVEEVSVFATRIHVKCAAQYYECVAYGNTGKSTCGVGSLPKPAYDYFAVKITDLRAPLMLQLFVAARQARQNALPQMMSMLYPFTSGKLIFQPDWGANDNRIRVWNHLQGLVNIEYDPLDYSGQDWGCNANDCRPAISARMPFDF